MTKNLKQEILKCNILQTEYKHLSNIICDLENVIIQNENILMFSKNQVMNSLNELIKKLNENYNDSSMLIRDIILNSIKDETMYSVLPDVKSESESESDNSDDSDNTDDIDEPEHNSYNNTNNSNNLNKIDTCTKDIKKQNQSTNILYNEDELKLTNDDIINLKLYEEIKNSSINNDFLTLNGKYNFIYELIKYDPFSEIKKQIIILSKIVGFTSLTDIIYLSLNINKYQFMNNYDKQIFNLLSEVFIPLDFTILKTDSYSQIKIKKIDSPYIVLINNYCQIEICIGINKIKINGYIINDPLNTYLRTSQITNDILYNKKISFETIIEVIHTQNFDKKIISMESFKKLIKINKEFADVYLKNITLPDLLILSNDEFVEKLFSDYLYFNELNKMHLEKTIKTFTKDVNESLFNMYNIIKLLLLGSNTNCITASLLFNLLKDKKSSGNNEFISNIIYQHLNYVAQLKLKKTSINIKNELEKIRNITSSDIDLKKQVLLSKNMPENVKKICLDKLDELKNANNETYKIKLYVNILIQFPWVSNTDDNIFKLVSGDKPKSKLFLENIETKLNQQIYGHEKAKNKILQILAKLISVQGTNITPIALSGPPGVGKTKFAQCLAECLDIPFIQITLGGNNDGELLHGHGYTYSGSQPGLIVKKMAEVGSARCIMYFDELDKCVSKNGQVNELMSILIHLTDPMTNSKFQDRFFQEITFPLNKVIFIFSFNDINKIDRILLDRLEVIDVESYSIKEKFTISNDYLIKEVSKQHGFDYGSVIFNQDILTYLIEEYTFEPGVRSLKKAIVNIFEKLNINRIYQRDIYTNNKEYTIDKPLVITKELIKTYLGDTSVSFKTIHSKDIVGVVNGLYATTMCSGGIVPIQLTGYHAGKSQQFVLKLTGNQKKIMKESIFYSFTTAINLLTVEGKELFFKKYPNGIHIHTPEAATPKDGPSAGVAFTLAFLSIMLDLKINREIALTGEIDLHGNVTKIGGVKYKIQGAFKAGVKTVFLPHENKDDVEKVKKELLEIFDDQHTCLFIDHVLQVAEKTLIGWETKKYLII